MPPKFFKTPADFRAWLDKHHATKTELLVGFYTKSSGKPSLTWPESVDQALCYGWIDGIRKNAGEDAYTIRFTPRKPKSNWSAVNIRRVEELTKLGLMQPAGLKAFEARQEAKSGTYSYEQRHNVTLDPAQEKQFKANKKAWAYFQAQAPSYQKAALWWVVSAKQEATRQRRLETLIADSAAGRYVPQFLPRRKPK